MALSYSQCRILRKTKPEEQAACKNDKSLWGCDII